MPGPFDFLLVEEKIIYKPRRHRNGRFIPWKHFRAEEEVMHYRCVGCREIRPFENGGAGVGEIEVVCDDCWSATRSMLERTCKAISMMTRRSNR